MSSYGILDSQGIRHSCGKYLTAAYLNFPSEGVCHVEHDNGRVDFCSRPSDDDPTAKFRIQRTPAGNGIKGVILSPDIVGAYTHYYRGRTRPHTTPYCEACDNQTPVRWHGYFGLLGKSGDVVIFEITATPVRVFDEYLRLHKTLIGALMVARRIGLRENARVHITLQREPDRPLITLPEPPDVRLFLSRLWDLKGESLHRGDDPKKKVKRSNRIAETNGSTH